MRKEEERQRERERRIEKKSLTKVEELIRKETRCASTLRFFEDHELDLVIVGMLFAHALRLDYLSIVNR